MNDFLNAIKEDLLDSRRRPILLALGLALIGAAAYAVIGGGSGSSTPASSVAPTPVAPISHVHVSAAQPTTNQAVAETTSGASQQRAGSSRDPFKPLPEAIAAATTTTSSSSSSSAGSTSTGTATSSGGTGSGSGSGSSKKVHVNAKTVFLASVLFGPAAPGTPPQLADLKPYENLQPKQALPSKKQPLLRFKKVHVVSSNERSVQFEIVGDQPPILRGQGACRPSSLDCQVLDLRVGQTEELEYLQPSGESVTYELEIAAIVFRTTIKAARASRAHQASMRGVAVLGELGANVPGMHYVLSGGVLAPSPAN
jgi:hypothetical protein